MGESYCRGGKWASSDDGVGCWVLMMERVWQVFQVTGEGKGGELGLGVILFFCGLTFRFDPGGVLNNQGWVLVVDWWAFYFGLGGIR